MKTIKRFVALALMMCIAATGVQAQSDNRMTSLDLFYPKHEVHVSLGMLSRTDLDNLASDIAGITFGTLFGQTRVTKRKGFDGNLNVGYAYHVTRKIALGLTFSYSQVSGDIEGKNTYSSSSEWEIIGKKDYRYYTLMPTFKANWIHKPHFCLYSSCAAGVRFHEEVEKGDNKEKHDSFSKFTYQVSPLGLEGGAEHIRGFMEFGYGQCGILQAGLRCMF